MCEYSIEDILANWKYQRVERNINIKELGQYRKLSLSVTELENLIVERLSNGGVLSAYAKVSKDLGNTFGRKIYEEVFCLYELCNNYPYFDISEIEDVLMLDYEGEYEDVQEFKQVCMDIIVKCPSHIEIQDKLYEIQKKLFKLGNEDEVWFAYRNNFFPKEILEELYAAMKKENCSNFRLPWLIAWNSI